ncbi:hypothetical protein [Acidicapsa acidisoli]|uniref:hypothetical protein n=1 Tax=Acidicapsa acidisoli TaxID=1615681 RepID=UPI0021E01B31|nr:hypothetical protein [Acidicapsa acidisoli]
MAEQQQAYQDCIRELLRTVERLMAENVALRRVIADLRGPKMPDLYGRVLPEIERNSEPMFHTLHSYLREGNPEEIRRTLEQALNSHQEQMAKAPFQSSDEYH